MTSYFNGSVPLYISDEQITDIQNQIDVINTTLSALESDILILNNEVSNIQSDILSSMVQYYSVAPNDINLTGNTYVLIDGQSASSGDLPESQFTISSPGILQYIGTQTAFFLINYSVSGFIDSGTFPITFTLQKNLSLLPSSSQSSTFSFDTVTTVSSVSGFALTVLSTNDTISLQGRIEDASANALTANHLCLNILKVGV